VTDANGNGVPNQPVGFSSTDVNQFFGPITPNPDGTYTVTVKSSTNLGPATIKAIDGALSGQATLTQIASPSTTSLVVSPSPAVSNQPVTLVAAISGASGSPHGTVTFTNSGTPIPGCTDESVTPSSPTASCTTEFAATASPAQLSASFSPDAASGLDASSGSAPLTIGRDSTSVALGLSSPAVKIGANVTYIAFVTPAHRGAVSPSGSVSFFDSGKPISQCARQPLTAAGGASTATCTVAYPGTGTHAISATYAGDTNFAGAQGRPVSAAVQFLGTVSASMRWSFVSGRGYTSVLGLSVRGAPIGSTILVDCHGKGCPFGHSAIAVKKTQPCGRNGKRQCLTHGNIDLTSRFAKRHLRPQTTITVDVVRAGWIGRAYTFTVRSHQPPRNKAVCVAPGTSAPTACS
jgi:hypothetical protein